MATALPPIDVGTVRENACVERSGNDDGDVAGFVTAKSIPGAVTVTV